MMRVLFITGEFPPLQGGVGDCTNEIAKAVARLEVEPHVLTTAPASSPAGGGSQSPDANSEGGVHVHRLVANWNWSSLRLIFNTVRELEPAIVHIEYQTGAFGMHPAINFLPRYFRPRPGDAGRSPRRGLAQHPLTVTTFHDLKVPYLFPKAGGIRQWVTEVLARSSDSVIATTEEDYLSLQTWGLKSLALIPIGSNIPTLLPVGYRRDGWRARLGVSQDATLLSYFGFLNESKGAESLIRALVHIPGARLLMIGGKVGSSDPTNAVYLARVQNLIEELGLTSRVLWTGFTSADEVSANLLASDICVLPYRDGASFRRGSFMAALAHGLPIVTTSSSSPASPFSSPGSTPAEPEEGRGLSVRLPRLRNGENVLLVRPDNPQALSEAISQLAALPELRTHLSSGALELAEHFTWDMIAARHFELYRQLLGSAIPGSGFRPRTGSNQAIAN